MMRSISFLLILLVLGGCRDSEPAPDAHGTFETDDVTVSAETGGRLLVFTAREGERLDAGQTVAVVDTSRLVLERRQLEAARRAARARLQPIEAEAAVLAEQLDAAVRERNRVQAMAADDAVPQRQLDDAETQVAVLFRRIDAVRSGQAPVRAELESIGAQIALIDDRLDRSRVTNPVAGTVLVAFAETHEMTAPGRPLYRLADTSTMRLRAYVTGGQLASVTLGDSVTVRFDGPDGRLASREGTVTWISSEAEFTPSFIQTREERVNFVYAVRVRVPNDDGAIKAGMPGELFLEPAS